MQTYSYVPKWQPNLSYVDVLKPFRNIDFLFGHCCSMNRHETDGIHYMTMDNHITFENIKKKD